MKEDKIHVTSLFLSALVMFLFTLVFDQVALGFLLAILCFPMSKNLAKKINENKKYKKQTYL
ncbi:hypothetical protein [Enterococcus sp.]|uniref:hypothetical protein n=1 Tax=Enterococcus sp. TaxID=35783 RepID=UPI002FC8DE38